MQHAYDSLCATRVSQQLLVLDLAIEIPIPHNFFFLWQPEFCLVRLVDAVIDNYINRFLLSYKLI